MLGQARGLKLKFIRGPHFDKKWARGPHKDKKDLRGPQYRLEGALTAPKTVISVKFYSFFYDDAGRTTTSGGSVFKTHVVGSYCKVMIPHTF
jgi:hypothetical protein